MYMYIYTYICICIYYIHTKTIYIYIYKILPLEPPFHPHLHLASLSHHGAPG